MTIFKKYLHKIIDELDKTLALMGLLAATILTIVLLLVGIDRPMFVVFGIASIFAVFACALYLLIRRNLSVSTIPSLDQLSGSPRFYIVLNTLFFLLLSYSILSIYFSPEPHTRPLGYFISIALMAAIVALEILFLSPHKLHTYFILFKIIIIGLSLRWSQQLIFSSFVGIDPWWHEMVIVRMLGVGYVPAVAGQYFYMPLFHILLGATMLITNLDYKMAAMFSINVLQVLSDTLFIFLLGQFIVGQKVGLLASLLLMVANLHIMFGYWPVPNTMVAILILPILYLLFKMRKEVPVISISLTLFFMIALVLTHAFALWLVILLFAFWIGGKIYNRLYHERSFMPVTMCIIFLSAVLTFGHWMYFTGHLANLAIFIRKGFGFEEAPLVVIHDPLAEEIARQALLIPFLELLFNNIGMILFFALSFVGCFYFVSKRFGNIYSFIFVIGGVLFIFLGFFPLITGFIIIESRWIFFSQILFTIPLAVTLFLFCQIFKERLTKAGLISFMVFLLAFFMIMSSWTNMDNHIFAPNTGVRFALIESEMRGIDTITDIWDGDYIGTDLYTGLPLWFNYPPRFEGKVIHIGKSLLTGDFGDHHDMLIIIREDIVERPFRVDAGATSIIRLERDPRFILAEQGFSRIYDSRSVAGFIN